jgi:ribosome-binding protein aMBF1 (putative translation factor)
MEHQDWTTVILKKNKSNDTGNIKKSTPPKTGLGIKIKNLEDNESEKLQSIPTSTKEMGKEIKIGRETKEMGQRDLDKLCNFPANTIRNYENGSAVVVPGQLSKINKVLGTRIKKPKAN